MLPRRVAPTNDPGITRLDERLGELAALIDGWMRPHVAVPTGPFAPFYDMMAYHIGWTAPDGTPVSGSGGKRLRPILALLVCEALGGPVEAARGAAIAVELVHNFSLVHDDIQDESDYRRGRETVWRIWGPAQAINVGDALFALAQLALVEQIGDRPSAREAVGRLNASCVRLVEGQFLDLRLEGALDVSLELYEQMIAGKTAALIECACALGALAAEADAVAVAACADLGHRLGLAFQFQDDVLGVWGDPAVTGKPAGADIRSRKNGLPLVLALQTASGPPGERLAGLLRAEGTLDDVQVAEVLAIMEELDIRERAETMVTGAFAEVERALRRAIPSDRQSDLLLFCARLQTRVS